MDNKKISQQYKLRVYLCLIKNEALNEQTGLTISQITKEFSSTNASYYKKALLALLSESESLIKIRARGTKRIYWLNVNHPKHDAISPTIAKSFLQLEKKGILNFNKPMNKIIAEGLEAIMNNPQMATTILDMEFNGVKK